MYVTERRIFTRAVSEEKHGSKTVIFNRSLKLEKQKGSEFANELDRGKEQADKFDSVQTDYYLVCKNEMATLEKANLDLEEKLVLAYRKSECEMSFKEQFKNKCRKLKEVLRAINAQKEEKENWDVRIERVYDKLVELKNVTKIVENKFENISSECESEEMKFKNN